MIPNELQAAMLIWFIISKARYHSNLPSKDAYIHIQTYKISN